MRALCRQSCMIRRILSILALALVLPLTAVTAQAQEVLVTGFVVEHTSNLPIEGVNVVLTSASDSTLSRGTATSSSGAFTLRSVASGQWHLRVSFVGYDRVDQTVDVGSRNLDLGTFRLRDDVAFLDEVRVEAVQERVVVNGDTTEYNAAAFQVNPDASAEDLVSKMPGVAVVDGQITAQGKTVQKVLVDGREFFGDDPAAALRNLPSEVVDRIQVYERPSDQARFTGFSDGQEQMTINVVTREGRSNGQFGSVYAGGGATDRYQSGGTLNRFDGNQRITLLGLSNNINVQNFSRGDLSELGRGGRDFRSGGNSGINRTNAFGLNYANKWGDRTELTASYFLNRSDNVTEAEVDREYFSEGATLRESSRDTGLETRHRFSGRLEHEINDRHSLIFSPRLTVQFDQSTDDERGLGSLTGLTSSQREDDSRSLSASGWLLWRMKFNTEGRTLSANVNANADNRSADGQLRATTAAEDLDQVNERTQDGRSVSARISFTEPLGRDGQLQLSLNPSVNRGATDRATYNIDPVTGEYSNAVVSLTGDYDTETVRQRAGIGYRLNRDIVRIRLEMDFESQHLKGSQVLPVAASVDRRFSNVEPSAELRLQFSKTNELRLRYDTDTSTPGVSQLQEVIDNTNPLSMTSGNPDLEQSYEHDISLRHRWTGKERSSVLVTSVSYEVNTNTIGRESRTVTEDTQLAPGILLARGGRFSRPVNTGRSTSARAYMSVGRPLGVLSSNVNLTTRYSHTSTPALLDGILAETNTQSLSGGVRIGSNISDRVDFSVSYDISASRAENDVHTALDRDYATHRSSARVDLLPWGRLVLSSDVSMSRYVGIETLANNTVRWNAALGWKFLQDNSGELRLMMADILDSEQSVGRSVNDLYVEDRESNVLGRFILLNFTYTVRDFRQ